MYQLVWCDSNNQRIVTYASGERLEDLTEAIFHIRNGAYLRRQKEFFITKVENNEIKTASNFISFCLKNGIEPTRRL